MIASGSTISLTWTAVNIQVTVTPSGQGGTSFSTSDTSLPNMIRTLQTDNDRGAGVLATVNTKSKTSRNVGGLPHIEF